MAKCPVCNSRKGKRSCLLHETLVCTNCCGDIRQETLCATCIHYRAPSAFRKYHELPAFTPSEMEYDSDLTQYYNAIEGAINTFAAEHGRVDDAVAGRLIERLFDKYHFKDDNMVFDNPLQADLFSYIEAVIASDLPNTDSAKLLGVLGAVYHSIRRRTRGGQEYMNFVKQYVGRRVSPGTYIREISGLE